MKKVLVIALVGALVLTFTACGGDSKPGGDNSANSGSADGGSSAVSTQEPATEGEVFEFTYSGTLPDEHFITQQIRKAADLLKERSNGHLIMNVFSNNTLADSRGAIEGMQNNSIQCGEMSTAPLAGFTDKFHPFNLPYFFDNADECTNYALSDFFVNMLGDQLANDIGIRPIGAFYNSARSLSNNKREVVVPDDIKGLKIRVLESPIYTQIWESWGGQPTPMSFAELFTGLQQGTIDGQDNAPTITVTNKYYEVQKFYTTLDYIHDLGPVMVSEQFYQSLPEDLRQIFVDTFQEVIAEAHQMAKDAYIVDLQTIEDSGVKVTRLTDEQRALFKEASQPVYTWFETEYPDIDLNEYRAAIQ